MVTTPEIGEKLKQIRSDIKIIEYDPFEKFGTVMNKIIGIQELVSFKQLIHPTQIKNPEYWSHKYVLVNLLKSHFVNMAIRRGLVSNETVAWLDFGYCRSEDTLGGHKEWSYDFDSSKIHVFAYKDLDQRKTLPQIISTNDGHILGAKIVANKSLWPSMESMMMSAFDLLYSNNLVDDDQTLMLMCATQQPDAFVQHRIPDHQLGLDPFVIFKDFNTAE